MNSNRRLILRALGSGAIVIPLASVGALAASIATNSPRLDPADATAKGLNYTHESADADRSCARCQFYSDPGAVEWGPCVIFPGKLVSANGLCNSWFARAG